MNNKTEILKAIDEKGCLAFNDKKNKEIVIYTKNPSKIIEIHYIKNGEDDEDDIEYFDFFINDSKLYAEILDYIKETFKIEGINVCDPYGSIDGFVAQDFLIKEEFLLKHGKGWKVKKTPSGNFLTILRDWDECYPSVVVDLKRMEVN